MVRQNQPVNQPLIREFTKLVQHTKARVDAKTNPSDTHRLKHFRNALRIIKQYTTEIKSGQELSHHPGIGKGIVDRIDDILQNGHLSFQKPTKDDKCKQSLMEVIGVGAALADQFIQAGVTSVRDLKTKVSNGTLEARHGIRVTHAVKTGLKFYGKVRLDIPRTEMDAIADFLHQTVQIPQVTVTICGSYRRGTATSNDIDVLLWHRQCMTRPEVQKSDMLETVKAILTTHKFLKGHLDYKGKTKYMGFCKLKNHPVRRIDIRFVPYQSRATALLYFTGSKAFNEQTRQHAKQNNLILNEYGLYSRQPSGLKRVVTATEKDIFRHLQIAFMEPRERTHDCILVAYI